MDMIHKEGRGTLKLIRAQMGSQCCFCSVGLKWSLGPLHFMGRGAVCRTEDWHCNVELQWSSRERA